MQFNTSPALPALRAALGVVLPISCVGCDIEDRVLCCDCAMLLGGSLTQSVRGLDAREVHAVSAYEGRFRSMVIAAKSFAPGAVMRACGAALMRLVGDGDSQIVLVPPSREGTLRRGFEPVPAMLRTQGVRAPSLQMTAVGQQKMRNRAERSVRSFVVPTRLRRRVEGREVVLIDDVVTSGATVIAASNALHCAGATVVRIVALALTPRLGGADDDTRKEISENSLGRTLLG